MKKLITGIVLGAVIFGTTSATATQEEQKAYTSEYKFSIEGTEVPLNNRIVVINGRAYLPVGDIGSSLGYDISFKRDGHIDASLNASKFPQTLKEHIVLVANEKARIISYESKSTAANVPKTTLSNNSTSLAQTPSSPTVSISDEEGKQKIDISRKEEALRQDYNNFKNQIQQRIDVIKRENPYSGLYSSEEYDSQINPLLENKLELQSKLNALALDTSREAEIKRNKLSGQIDEIEEKVSELRKNQTASVRIEGLNKQLEDRRNTIEQAIKDLRK